MRTAMRFKVGQIVQNKKTSNLYRIIEDKMPIEPITQIYLSHVKERENEFEIYKLKRSKKLKKYYEKFRRSSK